MGWAKYVYIPIGLLVVGSILGLCLYTGYRIWRLERRR